ncbi:hypothetical protein E2R51_00160 [Jeotgalibacillus sp. S-D1]|uniref:hypothetical protein n=1 Tax=Jeotgalibacillus sp. S-D1 TaxID=2552189 RepID=UPI00105A7456|nr:hypothetical protein [Jeotgalibacillus sp. S-D1]TDL34171.1 hypothetical protein E2R51_00160 [Jeotgalibacillus sp. S-D1]
MIMTSGKRLLVITALRKKSTAADAETVKRKKSTAVDAMNVKKKNCQPANAVTVKRKIITQRSMKNGKRKPLPVNVPAKRWRNIEVKKMVIRIAIRKNMINLQQS